MNEQQSLSHTVWNCKYHIVWIPTYRKKSRFKELRQYVGRVLKDLAKRKECKIEEGHLLQIMFIFKIFSIPGSGFYKREKCHINRSKLHGRRKNFTGQSFWARGYHVSTVGRDEEVIRNYIRHQESEDRRIDQLDMY
jgi:putative transposase